MGRFDAFDHTLFTPPSNEHVNVWRYMDFTTFVALLNSSSLYLTRYDQFDDHFEGLASKQDRQAPWENDKYIDKASCTPEQLPTVLKRLWTKYQRQYIYVSCWHINDYESAAMWQLYAKSTNVIAIQTTYAKLRMALPTCFQIGQVKYMDHQTYINEEKEGFFTVLCKRKSFEHERELRVCYVDAYEFEQDSKDLTAFFLEDNTRLFETVAVDLQAFIESIRIAPGAPAWLVGLVKDTVIRFGYDLPVSQSSFGEYPFL